ncbi:hypothetical protein GQ53DRAFT_804699 [Thozetella sp. PMI_491]|nr:hypothetical protein GQ53DRAFT_804699 [Thozetella sp. PMI_491]
MLKFATLVAILASASLSLASPVQKREVGGVLICQGPNATEKCSYQVYKMNTCYNLDADFKQNAATFAPDGEGFQCFPRLVECGGICTSPTGCTFGGVSFNSDKKYNLTSIGWNKYITSFDCQLNTTTTTA